MTRRSRGNSFRADAELFFYDSVPVVASIALTHPLIVAASAVLTDESCLFLPGQLLLAVTNPIGVFLFIVIFPLIFIILVAFIKIII